MMVCRCVRGSRRLPGPLLDPGNRDSRALLAVVARGTGVVSVAPSTRPADGFRSVVVSILGLGFVPMWLGRILSCLASLCWRCSVAHRLLRRLDTTRRSADTTAMGSWYGWSSQRPAVSRLMFHVCANFMATMWCAHILACIWRLGPPAGTGSWVGGWVGGMCPR